MVVSSANRASGAPSCPKPPIIGAIADNCDRTCIKADDVKRYAIEADIGAGKESAYLLVSRDCLTTGIESKTALQAEPESGYWQDAWDAGKALLEPLPTWIGLAVNAGNQDSSGKFLSRSQARFHIHISCVRREVIMELQRRWPALQGAAQVSYTFAPLPTLLEPSPSPVTYSVYAVNSVRNLDPLVFLAGQADWTNDTVAVVGRSDETRGFVLIGHGDSTHAAAAEDVLQQTCATPRFDI
jgi:CDP-diacylglycerol pyrophosphatase